jgi:hypothetical protein
MLNGIEIKTFFNFYIPVQSPGLHHADVEKPRVQAPVPFLDTGGDGIILL